MIIPLPWVGAIAAGALLIGAGAGWKVKSAFCDAAMTEALEQAAARLAEAQAKVETSASQYEGERNAATIETRTREVELRTVYKDREIPASCAVPDDARRLLEGAINRANTRASGQSGSELHPPDDDAAQ
jgi:hypothetical protein